MPRSPRPMEFFIRNQITSNYFFHPIWVSRRSIQYILNYQKMTKDRIFRVEAYYKLYKDLVKTVPISYNYFGYNNSGSGFADGIELFWRDKKTFKDFDYWISYTYLNTKRDFMNYPSKTYS